MKGLSRVVHSDCSISIGRNDTSKMIFMTQIVPEQLTLMTAASSSLTRDLRLQYQVNI